MIYVEKALGQGRENSNVHNMKQFVGLASSFRKVVNGFSVIAKLLNELTKKNVMEQEADTSKLGLGSRLMQRSEDSTCNASLSRCGPKSSSEAVGFLG